jgi:hypothetical protein
MAISIQSAGAVSGNVPGRAWLAVWRSKIRRVHIVLAGNSD